MARTRLRPYEESKDGPLKTLLTKRKTIESIKTRAYSRRINEKPSKLRQVKKKDAKIWKHALYYTQKSRHAEFQRHRLLRARRIAEHQRVDKIVASPSDAVSSIPKLALVLRASSTAIPPTVHHKLSSQYRLTSADEATFVWHDDVTANDLSVYEPYIIVTYPKANQVAELLRTRGYAVVHDRRHPLSSNTIIENALGDEGIFCVEDLAAELHSCCGAAALASSSLAAGDESKAFTRFERINTFLAPFRLSSRPLDEENIDMKTHKVVAKTVAKKSKIIRRIMPDASIAHHVAKTLGAKKHVFKASARNRAQKRTVEGAKIIALLTHLSPKGSPQYKWQEKDTSRVEACKFII